MRTRRRFSAEFKAKVALEAIKGQETVAWSWRPSTTVTDPDCCLEARGGRKARQAVFDEKGAERDKSRDGEITKLHAKIGQLVVEAGFFVESLIAEPGSEEDDDRSCLIHGSIAAPVRCWHRSVARHSTVSRERGAK